MKFAEVKDLSVAELKKKKAQMSSKLFELRLKNSVGQVSNPLEIRAMKRDLARVATAIAAKQ
jgi:large subunit ribosomal protein L29